MRVEPNHLQVATTTGSRVHALRHRPPKVPESRLLRTSQTCNLFRSSKWQAVPSPDQAPSKAEQAFWMWLLMVLGLGGGVQLAYSVGRPLVLLDTVSPRLRAGQFPNPNLPPQPLIQSLLKSIRVVAWTESATACRPQMRVSPEGSIPLS